MAQYQTDQKPLIPLTAMQNFMIGSAAGGIEVLINHPLFTIKNAMHAQEPLSLHPRALYTGLWLNVFSKMPITAIQVGMNQVLKERFNADSEAVSIPRAVSVALTAGACSSWVSCPTERITSVMRPKNKQAPQVPFRVAVRQLWKEGGSKSFFVGMAGTVLREGPFSAFFLVVYPQLKQYFSSYIHNVFYASLAAGVSSGVAAAVLTQPADTIKGTQQTAKNSKSFYQTARLEYASRGVPGFFRGLVPRTVRVVSAVIVLGEVKGHLEKGVNFLWGEHRV